MINAPYTLSRRHFPLIAAIFVVLLSILCGYAKEKSRDAWQTREHLLTRLGGEWYKIGVLVNELNSQRRETGRRRDGRGL